MSNAADLAALKLAADNAVNAYFRAKPGGRRGWKRPVNQERLSRLCAEMHAATKALWTARQAAKAVST